MIVDAIPDLHGHYAKGTLWEDSSSFKKEDEMYDYYMMLNEWKFLGRFKSFNDALGGIPFYDN